MCMYAHVYDRHEKHRPFRDSLQCQLRSERASSIDWAVGGLTGNLNPKPYLDP